MLIVTRHPTRRACQPRPGLCSVSGPREAVSFSTSSFVEAASTAPGYRKVSSRSLRAIVPMPWLFSAQADAVFRFSAVPLGVDDEDLTQDQVRRFSGPVTSLTDVAPVPEPVTLLLVGSGVAAALRIRRRRPRRSTTRAVRSHSV